MGLRDVYENVMRNRERNRKVYEAKYKFLQRLSMADLQAIYDKYCYKAPQPYTKETDKLTGMDIYKMATSPSEPNTRQKFIDRIIEEMSWDSLNAWAKEHNVQFEDVKG